MTSLILAAMLPYAVPESPYLAQRDPALYKEAKPVLSADGFAVGNKRLSMPKNTVFAYEVGGQWVFSVKARVLYGFNRYTTFDGIKTESNLARGVVHRAAACLLPSGKGAAKVDSGCTLRADLHDLKDGRVKMVYRVDNGTNTVQSCMLLSYAFEPGFCDCHEMEVESAVQIEPDNWWRPTRITWRGATGDDDMALLFDTNNVDRVTRTPDHRGLNIICRKVDQPISITFDPGKAYVSKRPPFLAGGIDFAEKCKVNVAEYRGSPNVLMNPSFESGDRYWRLRDNAITNGVAHSGSRCLLYRSAYENVQTVGLVLKANQDYTFSAWVKAMDGGGRIVWAAPRGVRGYASFLKRIGMKTKQPHGEWQRVKGVFHTPSDFHECTLWIGVDGGATLIDDIQVEEGTKATAYAGNPFGLDVVSDQPTVGYADSKKPQNLRLLVRGPANGKAAVKVVATDFMTRTILDKAFKVTLGKDGEAAIPLGPDEKWPLGTTAFKVRVVSSLAERATPLNDAGARLAPRGVIDFTDYLRFTKIDARDGTDRLRFLQGTSRFGSSMSDRSKPEWLYARLRDFGIGTLTYQDNHDSDYRRLSADDYANLARFGFRDYWGGVLWSVGWSGGTLLGEPWKWEGVQIQHMTNYPPAMLEWVETKCCEMARKYPHIRFWSLASEPDGQYWSLQKGHREEYAKLMLAINRGLTRGNPKNLYVPYGCWNMNPTWGIEYVVRFLDLMQKIDPKTHFKAVDIHTYRELPEHPDVESDLQLFLKRLDEIGYADIKVKIGEGSYYYPVINPALQLYPWGGVSTKDNYSGYCSPTYDVGWYERLGAALTLRETLCYYRHADRVFSNTSWCPQEIDEHRVFGWMAMNANLLKLLGSSTFVEDVRFAPKCRAYVFDDGRGSTVAAVWRGDSRYDLGFGKPVEMEMRDVGLELIDMMGNRCEAARGASGTPTGSSSARGVADCRGTARSASRETIALPLSGFPFYLKVKNAKRDALIAALKGAKVAADETRRALLPKERVVKAPYFKGEVDWKKVPVQADSKIAWQLAWNEKGLRCRAVADAQLGSGPRAHLTFDSFGNGRQNFLEGLSGFDFDDFVYELRTPSPQNRQAPAHCFRVRAPDHQYTGGAGYGFVKDVVESNVVVRATAQGGKTVLEADFPPYYLMPLKLKAGVKFGFASELRPFDSYAEKPERLATVILER